MTTDKARKRAVRTRMQKTGERYAAARRHVVTPTESPATHADPSATPDAEPATLVDDALPPRVSDPGMADEGIRKGTGRGWDDWFRDLDAWGARARTHTEIARHVHTTFDINGWWAQAVTVGYERARGLRAINETTNGFEVSVSKTITTTPAELWPFLVHADGRARWVGAEALERRKGTGVEHKHARFDVIADGSRVAIYLTPKGDAKTVLTVTHERLDGADDVAARRTFWRAALGRLADAVAVPSSAATARSTGGLPLDFADLWSADRARQNAAYTHLMALTDAPVDWAYGAWDDVIAHLSAKDNHDRAIAAQLLCNLAKSDPAGRLVGDFPALFAVVRDDRFVTARHALQGMWKVGAAGDRLRALLLAALEARFREASSEKNGTLVRSDIIQCLRDLSDAVGDPAIERLALGLIELEDDPTYRKKYVATWRSKRKAA